jgi:2-dehydro-3-deoxyglucarate aldolase/4-hydroxy-2-oxoheptanedioate aldolase
MIEDPEAVDEIENILRIPGVDAAFIGQGDLTQTVGDRNKAQELVNTALQACNKAGIPACTTASSEDVVARFQQGFKWLTIGNDTGTFMRSVRDRLQEVRQKVSAGT